MSGSSSSVSIFPSGPLAADRLAAIAAAEVHEQHWLALVLATRLVRGPFPTAHAIELDVNQFAAGEGSLNLVRGYDQGGRTLWDLLWLDDDVAWTTTEGRDWSEVLGQPSLFGQSHHRHQSRTRHQVLIVEQRSGLRPGMR